MSKKLSRRELLKGTALVAGSAAATAALSGCTKVVTQVVEVEKEVEKVVTQVVEVEKTGPINSFGLALPPDARPLDQQVWKIGSDMTAAHGHWMKSLYNLLWGNTMHDEPLVGLDYNNDPFPCGAESWQIAEDGSYWDFPLRKELVWTDGTPVTAHDYEWTLKWTMGNGYDFGWYYSDVKNAMPVLNREMDPSELGVEALDDYTLRIYTNFPCPYLPMVMCFYMPMSKTAFDAHGEMYELDPATYNGCGPWTLTKFDRATGCEFELFKDYKGVRKVYFEKCIMGPMAGGLAAYMAGDVPSYGMGAGTPPGEQAFINTNPVLRGESHPVAPNITSYLGFSMDPGKFPPLDNYDVRLALCKAVDKETMVGAVGKGFALPAWGILPPGFVNYNGDVLKQQDCNVFDVEAARQLLSKAGYPDGKDFPEFEVYCRTTITPYMEAAQAAWKENLGITIQLKALDYASYGEQVWTNKLAPMYRVEYSLDYFDPSTFLNVFRDGGRHPHSNPEWTANYNIANATLDPVKRMELLKQSEMDLVNSLCFYGLQCDISYELFPCTLGGDFATPDRNGFLNGYARGRSAYNDLYWTTSTCRDSLEK